jgi:hypothetical protein
LCALSLITADFEPLVEVRWPRLLPGDNLGRQLERGWVQQVESAGSVAALHQRQPVWDLKRFRIRNLGDTVVSHSFSNHRFDLLPAAPFAGGLPTEGHTDLFMVDVPNAQLDGVWY